MGDEYRWPVRTCRTPRCARVLVREQHGRFSGLSTFHIATIGPILLSAAVHVHLYLQHGEIQMILLGWEFLVAKLLGGLILIAVMVLIVHLTLPENLFEQVRNELNQEDQEQGITEDPTC